MPVVYLDRVYDRKVNAYNSLGSLQFFREKKMKDEVLTVLGIAPGLKFGMCTLSVWRDGIEIDDRGIVNMPVGASHPAWGVGVVAEVGVCDAIALYGRPEQVPRGIEFVDIEMRGAIKYAHRSLIVEVDAEEIEDARGELAELIGEHLHRKDTDALLAAYVVAKQLQAKMREDDRIAATSIREDTPSKRGRSKQKTKRSK